MERGSPGRSAGLALAAAAGRLLPLFPPPRGAETPPPPAGPARRPPLPSATPLTCPRPCGPAGAAGRSGRGAPSGSVPVAGPSGRPAPVWVGRGRKPFSALRNRYLHVSSSDPGRYRSLGASFWPGLGAAGRQLHPQAPGVAAAPALEQRAGGCQVPTNPKGREGSNSVPGSTACEISSVSFPLLFC